MCFDRILTCPRELGRPQLTEIYEYSCEQENLPLLTHPFFTKTIKEAKLKDLQFIFSHGISFLHTIHPYLLQHPYHPATLGVLIITEGSEDVRRQTQKACIIHRLLYLLLK